MNSKPTRTLQLTNHPVTSEENQANSERDFSCLNFVLDNINGLPTRNDEHMLTTEQDLLRLRYRRFVQCLITRGACNEDLILADEREVDEIWKKLAGEYLSSKLMFIDKSLAGIVAREAKEDLEAELRNEESEGEDKKKKERTGKWKRDRTGKGRDGKYRQ